MQIYYQSIFFVATAVWIALVVYIAYLHKKIADLEKNMKRLTQEK
ncbi:MAG TPA: CcmD family protein [Euryarchaeota archaeon]|nr:hypothetical protein BMS3Bbin15_01807 [archaeon BMS3Bbin15]HDL15093.1 CcmD family protein [Euryarchaeota archaeon]